MSLSLSTQPKIKDNFGNAVAFVPVDCSLTCDTHKVVYVKNLINLHKDRVQREILSKCFHAGPPHLRREVQFIPILHDNITRKYTCELRVTPENHLLCFLWDGRIELTYPSESLFIDTNCYNFHIESIWQTKIVKKNES